jgi:hypothetical protein
VNLVMARSGRWVAALGTALVFAAALGATPASASTGWVISHTPRPDSAPADLDAVSCSSGAVCMAVGFSQQKFGGPDSPSVPVPLAERKMAGSPWVIEPTPDPDGQSGDMLTSVSCPTATACLAVGSSDRMLAESWDGSSWSVQDPANPDGGSFSGVSCASATSCTAVGETAPDTDGQTATLAEHWDGTSWTVQATPNPAGTVEAWLLGVSCSSATACTAVGGAITGTPGSLVPLAERWDGASWTIESMPSSDGRAPELTSVSCPAASSCTAVGWAPRSGHHEVSVAEHWNGTNWKAQSTPNPPDSADTVLQGVSCGSAFSCTAVGEAGTGTGSVAEHWDSTGWTIQALPVPGGGTTAQLQGVYCTAPAGCTATGFRTKTDHPGYPLAEHYYG